MYILTKTKIKNKKQDCIENPHIPINMNVNILHLYLRTVYLYVYVFYCACVMWERSHAMTLGWRSEDSSVESFYSYVPSRDQACALLPTELSHWPGFLFFETSLDYEPRLVSFRMAS